ncbi:hypothetical protein IWW48_000442 [Coemansia sp. RSA 1200]|nr:hypothetical protein IWW48_000442 [Coemansia sp. RSA 1200]
MQTRGSTASKDTSAVSTPPPSVRAAEANESKSTRVRSTRAKSGATTGSEYGDSRQPAEEQQPMTPTRRSTRTAARKATELIHDTAEMLSPRKRAAARKTEEQPSACEEDEVSVLLSPQSSRKTGRGATTPRSSRSGARKMMETQDSDDASSKAAGSPIPRRCTTRRTASTESLASSTNADDEASAKETSKTPVRLGRAAKTGSSGESMDDMANKADEGKSAFLPPPHPDLTSAATALALLSTGESKTHMASQQHSPNQSVDESFKTPPESPQKAVPALAESLKGRQFADDVSKDDSSKDGEDDGFEDAVDEISDLSDVDDPHFTEIMSAKAASVVMSAAESLAGSAAGGSDSESDDDDEAPEAVTSKAPGITRASIEEANETHDAVVPNGGADDDDDGEHGLEQSVRAKKKRRARHRKRAVVVEAKKKMATALEGLSKRHTMLSNTLPSAIPQELRLDLHEKLVLDPRKRSTAAAETANNGKLDAAVLEQFAQQSKKRGIPDSATASSAERKRMRKEKKRKSSGNWSSRVVSGIKVVASRPPSKANLLATLAQSVPDSVRRFAKEKHGGGRVERSDPLLAIARSSNKAAISFFK